MSPAHLPGPLFRFMRLDAASRSPIFSPAFSGGGADLLRLKPRVLTLQKNLLAQIRDDSKRDPYRNMRFPSHISAPSIRKLPDRFR